MIEEEKLEGKKVEERKEKFAIWLKNPYNIILVLILLFAFSIRLYYFFLTIHQPLWWDEAEYMLKAKSIAFGTPDTGWALFRPPLFPIFASLFFKIGFGVIGIKIFWFFLSFFGVFLVYLVGKELFNKKIALIAATIYSVFYLDIFYMTRLLVDMPSVVFSLLAAFFFLKREKRIFAYLIVPTIAIGMLLRFNVALMFLIFFIFLLFVEGKKFLKEKNLWISVFIGFLILLPFFVWSATKFGSPLAVFYLVTIGAEKPENFSQFDVFMEYIKYFPNYIYTIFLIIFFVGLFYFYDLFIAPDFLRKEKTLQGKFLSVLWIIIPLFAAGFLLNHFEERYITMIFPAVFYVVGNGFFSLYQFVAKYNKWFSIIIIFSLFVVGLFPLVKYTDNIIKVKLTTYKSLEEAGLWIKENSAKEDIIFSNGLPQNTYYSERATYPFPATEEEFEKKIAELKPKYMILSIWEKSPEWTYTYPERHNGSVRPVQVYFFDKKQKQVSAVVYEFIY